MPRDVRQQLDCPPAQASNYGGARACKSDVEAVIAKAGNTQRRVASIGEVPYQTGQIILIERPGAVSLFLSLMAERFAPYIHAGVIVVDDGTPYVYEAFGFLMPRMSGSPTDGMRGGVRRVTLASFLNATGSSPYSSLPRRSIARRSLHTSACRQPAVHRLMATSTVPTRPGCTAWSSWRTPLRRAAPNGPRDHRSVPMPLRSWLASG